MKRSASPLHVPTLRRSSRQKTKSTKQLIPTIHWTARRPEITPLLQALPLVLSSGFLWKHSCIKAAATCQNWCHSWKEVEDHFPEDALVELKVKDARRRDGIPPFIRHREGLWKDMHTPGFARQILDKVNEIKVMVKKTPGARNKRRLTLPVWGHDIRFVRILYWDRNSHNPGGISISYYKDVLNGYPDGRSVEDVRVDIDLELWTVKGLRDKTWLPVYVGEQGAPPVWP